MFRTLALAAITVALAAFAGPASAETITSSASASVAQSRLDWAKRHVELVCKPLETRGEFERATRCYNDVTRLVGEPSKATPAPSAYGPATSKPAAATRPVVKTAAAKPAAKTAAVSRPAPARVRFSQRAITVAAADPLPLAPAVQPSARRCVGVSCLQYTLLGVGF